ncbi:MAG: hypothetical protein WB868_10670 [Xanthobacteraceae bacterium]
MLRSCSKVLVDRLPLAALLTLVFAVSGCSGGSSSSIFGGPPAAATSEAAPPPASSSPPVTAQASPSSQSLKDKIEGFFETAGAASDPRPVVNTQQANVDCPLLDIRQGAGTLTIPPPPPDGSNDAMSLKYQGTFVRAARDCKVVAGQLVMKIGVQGRVIVGPAGGPGSIEVPLRLAVVDQSPAASQTILTKLIIIPVTVASDDTGAIFTHIEDDFAFPLPSSAELDNYIVYIGFDPIGAAEAERARPRPRPAARIKPKPKLKPNSAPTG